MRQAASGAGFETAIFDGQFDAGLQYGQIEDVLASGNFDAFVVVPNDTVGISGAFEQVIAAGIPIVTTLFPIGPDLTKLTPQITGITSTVASDPVNGAAAQAENVAAYCETRDPCNVVILIGAKIFPFDNLRLETFRQTLSKYNNIKILAVGEGYYDPDTSLTAMTDILQANSDVHVILSNADQHLIGAEIALDGAGYDVPSLYMSGGGASGIAIDAIREGRWDVTLAHFPMTMGRLAGEQVIHAVQGKNVTNVIDMDTAGPLPFIIDAGVLARNPGFTGEWEQ